VAASFEHIRFGSKRLATLSTYQGHWCFNVLIEVKSRGLELKDMHIKQAVDYATRQGGNAHECCYLEGLPGDFPQTD
jgi:hypothetical protein